MRSHRITMIVLTAVAAIVTAGCREFLLANSRFEFVMGVRGGGAVHYRAFADSSTQSGDCTLSECRVTLGPNTDLWLTPAHDSTLRFVRWDGDPARQRTCKAIPLDSTGTIHYPTAFTGLTCIAVFEPGSGGGPSVPR